MVYFEDVLFQSFGRIYYFHSSFRMCSKYVLTYTPNLVKYRSDKTMIRHHMQMFVKTLSLTDDFGVGFLIKCNYAALLRSSLKYKLDTSRYFNIMLLHG